MGVLGKITDLPPSFLWRLTENPDCTPVGLEQAEDDFQQRGFAASVGPDDAGQFSFRDLQIDLFQHRVIPVVQIWHMVYNRSGFQVLTDGGGDPEQVGAVIPGQGVDRDHGAVNGRGDGSGAAAVELGLDEDDFDPFPAGPADEPA